jgi:hypothetical protein
MKGLIDVASARLHSKRMGARPGLDWNYPPLSLLSVKETPPKLNAGIRVGVSGKQQAAPDCCSDSIQEIDVSLLEDSLAKTPWERMQANDDALRYAESLRAAMQRLNAKPKRTDEKTR